MKALSRQANLSNRSLWTLTTCYVLIIFMTLPVAPFMIKFISRFAKLDIVVNTSLAISFMAWFTLVVKKMPGNRIRMLFLLVPLAAITVSGLRYIRLPVERIHIVEYGFLSVLLFRALRRRNATFVSAFISIIATSLIGTADEGVQFFLPNRFYSTQDILFNTIGGFAGLCYYGFYTWGSRKKQST